MDPLDPPRYGSTAHHTEPNSPYTLREEFHDEPTDGSVEVDSLDDEYEMSLSELLYSSSSYHAIVKPGMYD